MVFRGIAAEVHAATGSQTAAVIAIAALLVVSAMVALFMRDEVPRTANTLLFIIAFAVALLRF